MKLIVEENTQKMSESALHILLGAMMQDKRVNISLTSGRSPIELYKMLAPEVRDQEKFKDIEYYLFDEAPYMMVSLMVLTGKKCRNYSSRKQIFQKKEFMI